MVVLLDSFLVFFSNSQPYIVIPFKGFVYKWTPGSYGPAKSLPVNFQLVLSLKPGTIAFKICSTADAWHSDSPSTYTPYIFEVLLKQHLELVRIKGSSLALNAH